VCILEASFCDGHVGSDGIGVWVLDAEASFIDGYVGKKLGVYWKIMFVGNVGERLAVMVLN
jgi:hypothetical protein